MTARITVLVTQEDIDNGCHDGDRCPVHDAIQRALPHLSIDVGMSDAFFYDNDRWDTLLATVRLPARATRWIDDYDSDLPVEPSMFLLDVPDDLTTTSQEKP